MTRFWLIRHGEPAEDARGRCYGSLDVGLSERGREQMAQVAEYLKGETIAAIYTSPRSRAIEGLRYEEIAARYPDLYRQWMETPARVRFPNGESFPEMRARVLGVFDAIQREAEGKTLAIVSHGGVNRVLIAWALQTPDDCLFRLAQDYAAINLLAVVDGFPSVRLLNHTIGPRSVLAP